jgi:hypothetical protein
MLYYYVDETYIKHKGYWWCAIGGILIEPSAVVDAEIALATIIHEKLSGRAGINPNQEFKFSNFFRDVPDDLKLEICQGLNEVMASFEHKVIVSCAKCNSHKLSQIANFAGGNQAAIQMLSFMNVSHFLAPYKDKSIVQLVVDLGLNEAFKPVYRMYVGKTQGVVAAKIMGVNDEDITEKNYRNLPVPLFVDSVDSRLMQLSDLLTGLALSKESGRLTGFKARLYEAADAGLAQAEVSTVEWNAINTQQTP